MPGIDEKALDAAMEAYCIHLSGRPDRGRLANAIAAYNAALTPAASEAVKGLDDALVEFVRELEDLQILRRFHAVVMPKLEAVRARADAGEAGE